MKYLRGSVYAVIIFIFGMYGWYLLATAINGHADQAATVVIEDVLSSNIASDIQSLRKLRSLIESGKADEAATLAEELIDSKLYMLSHCISDKCKEMELKLSDGESL